LRQLEAAALDYSEVDILEGNEAAYNISGIETDKSQIGIHALEDGFNANVKHCHKHMNINVDILRVLLSCCVYTN
jgi:hypothetical protein